MKTLSAAQCGFLEASEALEKTLRRFGPVLRLPFTSFGEAVNFLLPLQTFPTRYLVLGYRDWSLVVNSCAGEHSFVDVLAISRTCGGSAITTVFRDNDRVLQFAAEGKTTRWVESQDDGDRWHYLESGEIQPFENPEEYQRKRKKDRLRPACLPSYFERVTGLPPPDWFRVHFDGLAGLERSTREFVNPVRNFETARDLSINS